MPFQITEAQVDALLDRLSSDEEFRSVFKISPRLAMAAIGHEAAAKAKIGDQGVWSCAACKQLASPEVIKATQSKIKQELLSSLAGQQPVSLDVAKPADTAS